MTIECFFLWKQNFELHNVFCWWLYLQGSSVKCRFLCLHTAGEWQCLWAQRQGCLRGSVTAGENTGRENLEEHLRDCKHPHTHFQLQATPPTWVFLKELNHGWGFKAQLFMTSPEESVTSQLCLSAGRTNLPFMNNPREPEWWSSQAWWGTDLLHSWVVFNVQAVFWEVIQYPSP